jgi:hypothetical protein
VVWVFGRPERRANDSHHALGGGCRRGTRWTARQLVEHANQPVVTCEFPVPPELSPDGTTNWIFRVTGYFRS